MAGAGIALVIAGLWRVDGILATLGVAAWCLLALARVMARMNVAGLDLVLECPEKVKAGAVFPIIITLVNHRRWLDAFAVRIELRLAGQVRTGGRAVWVSAGSAADLDLRVALPMRGSVEKHRLRLVSNFPFGLFEAVVHRELVHRMCVLPKPALPRDFVISGCRVDSLQAEWLAPGEAPGELRSLRPWRAGDSPRRIVWPSTLRSMARGAGMVVRETDPPGFRPERCVVLFHSYGANGGLIRPDHFERAMSLAAGILTELHSQGVALRWIADFEKWKPRPANTRAQMAACLEALGRAVRAPDTEAHDLQAALAEIGVDEGLVILSDMPPATWREFLPRAAQAAFTPEMFAKRRRLEVAR